jgi:putative transposase
LGGDELGFFFICKKREYTMSVIEDKQILTYNFRIKDATSYVHLKKMSRAVNFVWNYCNETSFNAIRNNRDWLKKFDFNPLVKGAAKDLGLHSQTVQAIAYEYVTRRDQFKKRKLRWRGKKSLGWIPLGKDGIKIEGETLVHNKKRFCFWKSREIEGKIKCGSISQDARGRWYLSLQCEVRENRIAGKAAIGIDLGQKTFATISNGDKHDTGRWYRKFERKLALAQKAKKKKLIKSTYAKITNKRKDALHKLSDKLVKENGLIVVGDVGGLKMCKTQMAKSVLDAGWSSFRTMLEYKAIRRHGVYVVVKEHNTTRTCSVCEEIPDSSPKGLKGLGVREWVCNLCHTKHDRDVNAALNILRLGHQALGSKGTQESPTKKSKVA